jgi:alkanesulfonate monooxygenase SsuD/methylene tetrahydromethanopterin reductase-like flavin-dependent oxidoreductase (luciferase family)
MACGPPTGWSRDKAGWPRPRTGIGLHATLATRPGRTLADTTVATLRSAPGIPGERARQVAVAGTPAQVAEHLARYVAAGAELIVVVCDPAPTLASWDLLAEARHLLRQRT